MSILIGCCIRPITKVIIEFSSFRSLSVCVSECRHCIFLSIAFSCRFLWQRITFDMIIKQLLWIYCQLRLAQYIIQVSHITLLLHTIDQSIAFALYLLLSLSLALRVRLSISIFHQVYCQ
jgi:hypothetical protein